MHSYSDSYIANVKLTSDYPFDSVQPGRFYTSDAYNYGFNGQEKDDEVAGSGNSNTAQFWQYDTRLGRRWNLDPKPNKSISRYVVFANSPIKYSDPLGDTIFGVDGDAVVDPIENPEIVHHRASSLDIPERVRTNGSTYTHTGWDIYAPVGTNVKNIYEGIVVDVYNAPNSTSSYGTSVVVAHYRPAPTPENPDATEIAFYSFYAHLSSVNVEIDDAIGAGDIIGKSGKSGNAHNVASHRTHLHFEVGTEIRTTGAGRKMPTTSSRFSPNLVLPTNFIKNGDGAANQSGVMRSSLYSIPSFIDGGYGLEFMLNTYFPYVYGVQSDADSVIVR